MPQHPDVRSSTCVRQLGQEPHPTTDCDRSGRPGARPQPRQTRQVARWSRRTRPAHKEAAACVQLVNVHPAAEADAVALRGWSVRSHAWCRRRDPPVALRCCLRCSRGSQRESHGQSRPTRETPYGSRPARPQRRGMGCGPNCVGRVRVLRRNGRTAAARLRSRDPSWRAIHARQRRAGLSSCNASKCNAEVTGWLRRKRLDEGAFLVRHLEVRTALAMQFRAVSEV